MASHSRKRQHAARAAPGSVSALLLAAGAGGRLGGIEKAFLALRGRTLLEREVMRVRPHCKEILVGVRRGSAARARRLLGRGPRVLEGGATRVATVRRLLAEASGELVLVCDVARPRVTGALIRSLLRSARTYGAAVPALRLRLRESLGVLRGPWVHAVLPREGLFVSQTPHAYRAAVLRAALARAARARGAEAPLHLLALRAGCRVRTVPGEARNLKLTFPEDLQRAGVLALIARRARGRAG